MATALPISGIESATTRPLARGPGPQAERAGLMFGIGDSRFHEGERLERPQTDVSR